MKFIRERVFTLSKNKILIFTFLLIGVFLLNAKSAYAAYRNTIEAEGTLLYYWPMDESAGATSLTAAVGGTAINLTGATAGASGQVDGTAVSFNGTSNFGATASSINLTAYNKVVVEALVYFNNYTTSGTLMGWELGPGIGTQTTGFYFADKNGNSPDDKFTPAVRGDAGYNYAEYTQASAGAWHLVDAVYNKGLSSNEVDLYIDGLLQTPASRPQNSNNTNTFGNSTLYLMSRAGSSLFSNGKMQHLAIYSDLSGTNILAHAQAAGLVSMQAGTLSESSHSTSTATLSWTDQTNGVNPITQQLQRSLHGSGSWSNVSGATASPATDSGLSPQTGYDYRVAYTDATPTTVYSNTLTVTTNKIYPAYTSNSDLVIAGPYDTAVSGTPANWGNGNAAVTSIDALSIGHLYRIRQNGTITQARLYTVNKTCLTGFYVTVYRLNGSTYTLVGKSDNIVSQLVAGDFATTTFATPITGVQEGDYYGMRVETTLGCGTFNFFARTGQAGVSSPYLYGTTTPPLTSTWAGTDISGTAAGSVLPIELYMQAPQVVFTGDSIMSGYPTHYSFLHTTETTNIPVTIERQFNSLTGYVYQNMGINAQRSDQIAARFTADVINLHPRIAVIEGGVNDIAQGAAKSTFITSWTNMLNAAQASDSVTKILVLKILPWSNGTNVQMQTRDDWNASLASLAAGYSKAVIVDASSYVGQFRSGGDAGNLWDIQAAYNQDGVHFTQSGYGQIAQALADNINFPPTILTPTFSSVTATGTTASSTISATGGANVTVEGFAWGTDTSYSLGTTSSSGSFGISDFSNATTTLTCGTTYHVRAYGTNSGGTSYSPDGSFTTNTCAATAYTLTGPLSGNVGSVSTDFTVTPNGPYTGTVTITPTLDFGLISTTLTWSNSSSAQTFTITPTAAGLITLTPTNNGGLTDASTLTYTANATVSGQPTAVSAATLAPNQATVSFTAPGFTGGAAILYYLASSTPGDLTGVSVGPSSGSIVVPGLTNGTSYTFTVYAVNAVGTSTPSSSSNAVTPIGVPGAPTGVVATPGDMEASVTFSAPGVTGGSQITGYTVVSSPSGGTDTDAGSTALTHTVTGLTNGTQYTFTVTATNVVGTGSASSASNPVTPSTVSAVSTNSTTNIASTTAVLNGSIISTGGSDAEQRGFAYGTTADLSIVTATTTLGPQTGTGDFSGNVTGLSSNTTYYVRAYAVNAAGTTTGLVLSFLTLPAVPTMTTQTPTAGSGIFFTANGNIAATGGVNATVRGFVYGTTLSYGATTTETSSFGTGAYTALITGLACNTLYHVASYATNTGGTGYGPDQTITTGVCTKPNVAASDPSSITTTAATLNGSMTADGNASSTVVGFNWGDDSNYGHIASSNGIFGAGSFSQPLAGLACGSTYHYQVFATNIVGQGTSTDQSFTTSACPVISKPTVATGVSSGGGGSASGQVGNLIAMGNYALAQQIAKQYGLIIPPKNMYANTPVSNSGSSFVQTMKVGATNNDVKKLQIFLNGQGFIVAQKGAGSPGRETTYFGPATKAALMKFQLAHKKETLDPQGLEAPTGIFGMYTMKIVNKLMTSQ